MASPLGKLTAVLGIDAREFEKGLGGAQKSLTGLGTGSKAAFTILSGAAAIGFGVATKGALEAEAAQGKFMAATGATREEAKAFVSEMNGLAGTSGAVGKSFEQIAEVGTNVAQQFKVTGDEATELTSDILKFSKVTGQDAAGAAMQLEDTLSAFGLEAEDAAGLMDQLVLSNQKFGTDAGPATLGILQGMAPALQAMGEDLDAGVGLLNLFETAGLDAGAAQAGLKKAVANLKPGQSLDDLIAQIGAIEDPAERAKEAIEIFGAKSGVGLANAIKPGMTSLDDFEVSVGEAAGTVETASEDMLTLSDRIKGWADKALAGAREVGNQFGPALTGLSSLASLSAPFAGKLSDLFKGLIAKVLPSAVATGVATGTAEGTAHAGAATGPSVLRNFLAKFGLMTAPKVAAAAAAGTAVGTAEGGAAAAAMGGPSVLSKAGVAGKAIGSAMGAAMTAAIGLVLVDLAIKLPQFAESITATFKGIENRDVPGAKGALQDFIDLLVSNPFTAPSGIVTQWGLDSLPEQMGTVGTAGADAFAQELYNLPPPPPSAGVAQGEQLGMQTALGWNSGFATEYEQGNAALPGLIKPFVSTWNSAFATEWASGNAAMKDYLLAPFREIGAGIPGEIGRGMQQEANKVNDAATALRDILENGTSPKGRANEFINNGKEYINLIRQGMNSQKDGARETAIQVAVGAINAIEDAGLGVTGKGLRRIGQLYGELLANGLSSTQARAALAAGGVAGSVIDGLEAERGNVSQAARQNLIAPIVNPVDNLSLYDEGRQIGRSLAAGLDAMRPIVRSSSQTLARIVTNNLQIDSPAKDGPWRNDPIKRMFASGRKLGGGIGDGLRSMVRNVAGAAGLLAGVATPNLSGLALATARVSSLGVEAPGLAVAAQAPGHSGTTVIVNINAPVYGGRPGLRQLGEDIAREARFAMRGNRLTDDR